MLPMMVKLPKPLEEEIFLLFVLQQSRQLDQTGQRDPGRLGLSQLSRHDVVGRIRRLLGTVRRDRGGEEDLASPGR